ncbi:hypothetical protein R1flu_010464 [Riccia fluitans]|uniref:Uncharacterized protein n=1 Tax=Riccia fluitans TaxID=41844 RepID=A0ABD1Z836_9MARC
MATWSEELRRLTLFDGEAKLTPESRPIWQQSMELRTRFMQAEDIPAKVFFSIVSMCRYVAVAEKTKHLELRGLTGQRLVVTPEMVREAFGLPRDAAHDEEQGATWPNPVALRFAEVEELGVCQYFPMSQDKQEHLIYRVQTHKEPAGVPLQIINDYLLCKVGGGPAPSRRYNLPAVSAFLRLTYYRLVNWAYMLVGGLASTVKEYVRKFPRGTGEAVVMVSWAPALMKIIKHNRALSGPDTTPAKEETSPDIVLGSGARDPNGDVPDQNYPDQATELDVGVVPSPQREVQELSSNSSPEQPPRKEARMEEPPQQAEEQQEDTVILGFETSDDELLIGTLRMDISRLRQEVQRTKPLVIRDVGGEGPAGRQEPSHEEGKEDRPVVQSGPGGNPSAQPSAGEQRGAPATVEEERPDIGPRYTDEEVRRFHPELFVQLGAPPPTVGAPQPIPVERTLMDRLAKISRPEAMSGIVEEDQAVCDMIPQVPGLTIHAPATDRIDELQVLYAAVASWVGELKQEVAKDRWDPQCFDRAGKWLRWTARGTICHLLTTPEEPTARDLVECLVLQNNITVIWVEEAEKRVQERDERLRQAQDDLRQTTEELAKVRTDWEEQTRALQEELHKVRNDVVQWEEETGRWIRNEEKMAEFVREIARLREELLAKDAKLRDL